MYYQQGFDGLNPVDLQNYLTSSMQVDEKLQAPENQQLSYNKSKETSATLIDLKMNANEADKEKLKSIIKEQEDLIKQQHAVIEQYEQEIGCLKSINKSILHSPFSLAASASRAVPVTVGIVPSEPVHSSPSPIQIGISTEPKIEKKPRDKRNDLRLFKKGWPDTDNNILRICFSDFIEGNMKYPSVAEVDSFLSSHPDFLMGFNLSPKEKKSKMRSQLNNMKRTREKQKRKMAEQQFLSSPNPPQIPHQSHLSPLHNESLP